MKTNHFFLLIGLIILMVACLPAGSEAEYAIETPIDRLAETEWALSAIRPTSNETPVLTKTAVTLKFEDGQLQGSSGCNSYSATYAVDGRSLTFGPIAVTEMACLEPGIMEQEAAFLAALSTTSAYDLANEELSLTYASGILRFVPETPPQPAPLTGTTWQLETLQQQDGQTVSSMAVPDGMLVTLQFQEDQLGGSTGCNNFGAPYQVNGGQLTLEAITKTEAICLDEAQILAESQFFNGVAAAKSFTIAGDQLTISYPGGSLIFRTQAEASADVEQAQEALLAFFDYLHNGRYPEAAALYGGSYETMAAHNPDFDANDHAGLLQQACLVNGAICLGVETAVFTNQPSPGNFDFLVTFATDDGTPFTIQLPEQPPQTQFPFTIQMTEPGSYRVVTPLAYSP